METELGSSPSQTFNGFVSWLTPSSSLQFFHSKNQNVTDYHWGVEAYHGARVEARAQLCRVGWFSSVTFLWLPWIPDHQTCKACTLTHGATLPDTTVSLLFKMERREASISGFSVLQGKNFLKEKKKSHLI